MTKHVGNALPLCSRLRSHPLPQSEYINLPPLQPLCITPSLHKIPMRNHTPQEIQIRLHAHNISFPQRPRRFPDSGIPRLCRDDDFRNKTVKLGRHDGRVSSTQMRVDPHPVPGGEGRGVESADAEGEVGMWVFGC